MIARILVGLISLYQRRGGGQRFLVECNYTPSCSEYAKTAIERFGVRVGVGLAIARIRRCNSCFVTLRALKLMIHDFKGPATRDS